VTGNQPVDEPKLASSQHDEPSLLQAINQTLGAELEGLKAALTRQESDMQPSKSTVRSSEEANRSRPEPLQTSSSYQLPGPKFTGASGDSPLLSLAGFSQMIAPEQQGMLLQCPKMKEQYKRSRIVLPHEVSQQELELDRLQTSSQALSNGIQDSDALGECWQAKARAALSQVERLKEMLSEGASWAQSTPMLAARMSEDSRASGSFEVQHNNGVNAAGVPDHSTDSTHVCNVPIAAAATEASGESRGGAGSADDPQDIGGMVPQQGIAAGSKCKHWNVSDQQIVEQQVHAPELDLQLIHSQTFSTTQHHFHHHSQARAWKRPKVLAERRCAIPPLRPLRSPGPPKPAKSPRLASRPPRASPIPPALHSPQQLWQQPLPPPPQQT
jgi:hypothetical protein